MKQGIKKLIPKSIKKKIVLSRNKGNKYECPYCHYRSKGLCLIGLDFPVLKEKQVIGGGLRYGGCFNCGSSDRERLLITYLREVYQLFDKPKDIKILHIAPEKNLSNEILKVGFSNYICGDLFTEGYQYPAHVSNINVLNIPFDDNHFDLVICNHVLEHIPNDQDAMNEIYRVLSPSGKAILQVPLSKNTQETFEDFSVTEPTEREKVFGQFDHLRIYGQDYPKRLENSGFKVERINISEQYQQFGLNIDEDLFIGNK